MQEQKLYEKLRSRNHYHKRSGVEAVLHKKALERRAHATEGVSIQPAHTTKCIFTEGGVKCGERTLPVAKKLPEAYSCGENTSGHGDVLYIKEGLRQLTFTQRDLNSYSQPSRTTLFSLGI